MSDLLVVVRTWGQRMKLEGLVKDGVRVVCFGAKLEGEMYSEALILSLPQGYREERWLKEELPLCLEKGSEYG